MKPEAGKIIEELFVEGLLKWNSKSNKRQMPWKGEKDPYKIWLSEIILQQTRVEQGLKYYENFIKTFPTIDALAKAPEEKVFKLWEGLGYYSRCRNLIATAEYIAEELKGVFPSNYEAILKLKGIGSYTAAAIASFAYNLPYAVLDGNVFRVLSRILDIERPIDTTEGKKKCSAVAQDILPTSKAGEY
ncbi:MAG: A/G-specific adenine glycosylase, partial [Flavisolibacter sp.]